MGSCRTLTDKLNLTAIKSTSLAALEARGCVAGRALPSGARRASPDGLAMADGSDKSACRGRGFFFRCYNMISLACIETNRKSAWIKSPYRN